MPEPRERDKQDQILAAVHDVTAEVRDLRRSVDHLSAIVTGNGDPAKGLTLRVDRLEQTEIRRGKWTTAAIGASVAAVAGFIGLLIKTTLHP